MNRAVIAYLISLVMLACAASSAYAASGSDLIWWSFTVAFNYLALMILGIAFVERSEQ